MRAAPFFPIPFNLCQFINVILKDRERKRVPASTYQRLATQWRGPTPLTV